MPNREMFAVFLFFLQTEHFSGLSRPSKQRWIGCTLSANLRGKSWQVVIELVLGLGVPWKLELSLEPGSLKNKHIQILFEKLEI